MAFVAVDLNGDEWIYGNCPEKGVSSFDNDGGRSIPLPKGSIKKLIGRKLTFDDKPVELDKIKQ